MRTLYINEVVFQLLKKIRKKDEGNSKLLERIIRIAIENDPLIYKKAETSEELFSVAISK